MMRANREARAQTLIEFACVFGIFVLLVFGIMNYGVAMFQRSQVDYQLSRVGSSVNVWDAREGASWSDDQLKELLCLDTNLDPDLMEVENATTELIEQETTSYGDTVAGELGNDQASRTAKYLKVEADVSYIVGGGLIGEDRYERHVSRTYTIERRYEVS